MITFAKTSIDTIMQSWKQILYIGIPASSTRVAVPLTIALVTKLVSAYGKEAVEAAEKLSPHLILMDMSLPVMDGWEATRRIKQNLTTQKIPVIALTAHAMSGDKQKALEAGCDDYETKPVDLKNLLEKINQHLGN